jgi:curved DNA-binding protein CbpA
MKTVKIIYLVDVKTIEELRKAYYREAKIHHPDVGGDNERMKQLNAEFEYLSSTILDGEIYGSYKEEWKQSQWRTNEHFADIISKIVNLVDVEIEIILAWVWVSGETYQHKTALKEAGFKFSKNHVAWYWHEKEYRKMSRKTFSLDEIRSMFGSVTVDKSEQSNNSKKLYAA